MVHAIVPTRLLPQEDFFQWQTTSVYLEGVTFCHSQYAFYFCPKRSGTFSRFNGTWHIIKRKAPIIPQLKPCCWPKFRYPSWKYQFSEGFLIQGQTHTPKVDLSFILLRNMTLQNFLRPPTLGLSPNG